MTFGYPWIQYWGRKPLSLSIHVWPVYTDSCRFYPNITLLYSGLSRHLPNSPCRRIKVRKVFLKTLAVYKYENLRRISIHRGRVGKNTIDSDEAGSFWKKNWHPRYVNRVEPKGRQLQQKTLMLNSIADYTDFHQKPGKFRCGPQAHLTTNLK